VASVRDDTATVGAGGAAAADETAAVQTVRRAVHAPRHSICEVVEREMFRLET
jgi:hypothetical protein